MARSLALCFAVAMGSVAAVPTLARAQSADLVLFDRLAADPADPAQPADGKGVADVVILTKEALDDLAASGTVVAASCADLARSYVGIAVKAGAGHPDIAPEAALRATLLGARSVAYSRPGASGILFTQLIDRLGIAAEINARAKIIPQGFTAELLVSGQADLAVQQISELKLVGGVEVVGPIPRELQSPAVFSAGRLAASNNVASSDRLLTFLASPEAVPALRESGLEPFSP